MNPSEHTPAPLRKRLPWQFWLWQCIPMVCLIIVLPPGKDPATWLHKPAVDWFLKQPSADLLKWIVLCIWQCQGTMLAQWQIWGTGKWYGRLPKIVGLFLLASLLPVIWLPQHFVAMGSGVRPWSEYVSPVVFTTFIGFAGLASFLPVVFAAVVLHLFGYRLVQNKSVKTRLGTWQFSIGGLCKVMLGTLLVISIMRWGYPELNRMFEENRGWSMARSGEGGSICLVLMLATFVPTVLMEVVLAWRNWKVTLAIFGTLFAFSFGNKVGVAFLLLPPMNLLAVAGIDMGAMFILGQMIAMAINLYWIGFDRFEVIRQPKEESPLEA